MSEPFLAEIKIMSFNYAPKGWAFCNGQLMPINQNQALFSLLGTTYGGNGQTTFALPNLQGRTPVHFGNGRVLGEQAGTEAHAVALSELPTHTHALSAITVDATSRSLTGNLPAYAHDEIYSATAPQVSTAAPAAVGNAGGSQAHTNMQPYLTLNFCIALQGIFPSQF
jgi:microcystin-dependent protein